MRRALTAAERAELEARRQEIEPWVVGYDQLEADSVAIALGEMFAGFRSMASQSDAQAAATIGGLLRLLAPFPLWAIEKACQRIRSHGYSRKDGDRFVTERHWPPSDADIREAVETQVKLYRDQFDSADAILSAQVAKQRG